MSEEQQQKPTVDVSRQLVQSIVGKQNKTVRLMVAATAVVLGLGIGGAVFAFSHFGWLVALIVGVTVAIAVAVTSEIFVTLRTADVAEKSVEFATTAVKALEDEKLLISKILTEKGAVMMKLESAMHNKLGKLKPEARHAITSARKILTALETRLTVLSKLEPLDFDEDALRRYAQMSGPLEVPRKLQQKGKGSADIPPLPKSEWEPVLDHLIRQAEENLAS